MRSYNDTMDTIIYLKMNRKQGADTLHGILPAFHIREVRGETHLIYLEIPVELAESESAWPGRLAAYLYPFVKSSVSADTVLDTSVSNWLGSRGLQKWWEHSWPYPEYQDYRRLEYAQLLLKKAMAQAKAACQKKQGSTENGSIENGGCRKKQNYPVHVYVLGYEEYVPMLLAPYTSEIKTLTFVESRPGMQLEEYLETLYEEEGLAASRQMLMKGQSYRTARILWQLPAVVLDLTGEERLIPAGSGQGIFWIDMDSREEKRRRLEARCSSLTYFSMKEEWRSGSFALDTVPENGYNTEVNQGIFRVKR